MIYRFILSIFFLSLLSACGEQGFESQQDDSTLLSSELDDPDNLFNMASTPYCTNAHSDPDGDGWGWENNKTCKTGRSTDFNWAVYVPPLAENGYNPNNFPACNSRNSDPDKDGFGFENGKTCISGCMRDDGLLFVFGGNAPLGGSQCINGKTTYRRYKCSFGDSIYTRHENDAPHFETYSVVTGNCSAQ